MERNIAAHDACEEWKALVRAIATRRAHDSDFIRAIASYDQAKRDAENADEKLDKSHDEAERERVGIKLDEVSKLALSKGTWLLAVAIGEASVPSIDASSRLDKDKNPDEACISVKLSKLKSDILDYITHISMDVDFYNSILVKVRSYTEKLLEESEHVEPVKSITQKALLGANLGETEVCNSLIIKATLLVPQIRKEVSKIFKDRTENLSGNTDPKIILAEAKFAYTAYALRHLSINGMNRNSGFIVGCDPKNSYIYKYMKKLAKRDGYTYPKLLRYFYLGAMQLAEVIDVVSFATPMKLVVPHKHKLVMWHS